jgi:hypothetical protein
MRGGSVDIPYSGNSIGLSGYIINFFRFISQRVLQKKRFKIILRSFTIDTLSGKKRTFFMSRYNHKNIVFAFSRSPENS